MTRKERYQKAKRDAFASASKRPGKANYKSIPNYPLYLVGDDGSIWKWTWVHKRKQFRHKGHWKRLSGKLMDHGHLMISLVGKNCRRRVYIHRLVLEAFAGPCPPNMETRHYPDGDPTNNRLSNLQWGTKQQNRLDKTQFGI